MFIPLGVLPAISAKCSVDLDSFGRSHPLLAMQVSLIESKGP